MEEYLLISEAAREVEVENHVLRYWEVELRLPIKRNEQGHRYYSREDVERFKQIKGMKEKGLQLKAIKMIMKNGELDVLTGDDGTGADRTGAGEKRAESACMEEKSADIEIVAQKGKVPQISRHEAQEVTQDASKEEKSQRLQWLLQQLIREAVTENNRELCREIKESVVKELDYQFRNLEEREEQRDAARELREEEHFRKLDELLTKKARKGIQKKEKVKLKGKKFGRTS